MYRDADTTENGKMIKNDGPLCRFTVINDYAFNSIIHYFNDVLAMRPTLQNFLVTGGAKDSGPQVNPLQGVNMDKYAEL